MTDQQHPETLKEQVDRNAQMRGDTVWLISPETREEVSFAQAQMRIVEIAAHLCGLGLKEGASVAIAAPNSIGSCLMFMGVVYAGFVAVPLNLVAGPAIIGYTLRHCEAELIFVADECKELIESAQGEEGLGLRTMRLDLEKGPVWEGSDVTLSPPFHPKGQTIGLLMYTSGTTGKPKGVMLSHANLLAAGRYISSGHAITKNDRALCVLPIYHINGLCVTVMGTLVSASTLVMPYRFSVSTFWETIVRYACSWFSAVPTQYAYILNNDAPVGDLSHLRFARSASAPLSPDIHRRFEARFKVPIIETMGLTETGSQITTNPLPPAERKIGSPGAAYGNEIMVADAEFAAVPTGQTGEILVRGKNVMQGYFKQPDETAKTITKDGWLRTGDLGYMDEDGFIYVSGRIKELIIKGGENIAPREIDEALLEHPSILEAAAFAVPCENYGERVEACIRFKDKADVGIDVLMAHCVSKLGKFKSPDQIHVMEDLPKGPSGKVQRLKLYGMIYAA